MSRENVYVKAASNKDVPAWFMRIHIVQRAYVCLIQPLIKYEMQGRHVMHDGKDEDSSKNLKL